MYDGWRFPSFAEGLAAVRRLAQDGPLPTVLRLSDEVETALNLASPRRARIIGDGGCRAIVGYEGEADEVDRAGQRARRSCSSTPAAVPSRAPATPGSATATGGRTCATRCSMRARLWRRSRRWPSGRRCRASIGRFPMPYASRSAPRARHRSCSVTSRTSTRPEPRCTSRWCARRPRIPSRQWRAAKAAASDAILEAGGSITHHHGIGTDHRDWYAREVGGLAIEMLRAVKATLDPAGIMNPGVLIPPR